MLAVPGMDAECPKCNGVGYTLEHSTIPSDHYPDGDCKGNCPQQVQCDCQAEAPMPTTELQRDAIARGEMEQDARRYRRLQILGVAVCGSKNLDQGTVSRFSNLDAVVDEDLAAYPSRGEARLIVPREMEARAVAMEARCEKLEEALREIVPILGKTHYRGTLAMVRALLNAPTESTNESP